MKKVLLITNPRAPLWLETGGSIAVGLLEFAKAVTKEGSLEMMVTSMDRLEFFVSTGKVTIWDTYNNCDLSGFDFVHLRNVDKSVNLLDYARAITAYVHYHGHKMVEEADKGLAIGKLSQMVLFALNDLPVPKTVASWHGKALEELTLNNVSFPIVVKANNAMKGGDNHLVTSPEELRNVLENNPGQQYVVQECIPNDGDYRVLFGGYSHEPLVFKRLRIEGSHLSNTSKGAEPVRHSANELGEGYTIALQAAKTVGREFTGVDIMQNQVTRQWVLLEANANPALSMGAFLDEKTHLYSRMINEQGESA